MKWHIAPSNSTLWPGIGCPDFQRPFEDTTPPSAIVTLEYRRIRTEKEQTRKALILQVGLISVVILLEDVDTVIG